MHAGQAYEKLDTIERSFVVTEFVITSDLCGLTIHPREFVSDVVLRSFVVFPTDHDWEKHLQDTGNSFDEEMLNIAEERLQWNKMVAAGNNSGDAVNKELIEHWVGAGYTEKCVFPGEYMLLVNPKTMRCVRVYEDGRVWRTDPQTGEYERITKKRV